MVSHVPPGITVLRLFGGNSCNFSRRWYQVLILVLTFISYTLFHLSRKPPSIVKSVLDPCDNAKPQPKAHCLEEGWAPFNTVGGKGLLGDLDFAFLGSYAIGMYYAGHLGDHYDLRHFLSAGMLGSGTLVCLFGMGFYWKIHSLYYFLSIQLLAGFFQATGWPSVVTIVANWYGKGRRGLIMGIWNAHTSCGNILGSVIAAYMLRFNWGWSFLVPGLMMMGGGVIMFLFLAVDPEDVGHSSPYVVDDNGELIEDSTKSKQAHRAAVQVVPDTLADSHAPLLTDGEPLLNGSPVIPELPDHHHHHEHHHHERDIISFKDALKIPGVIDFSICLFFTKLVAYTFLMWLPYYIKTTPIAGEHISESKAGWLSTLFDVGGILGGILAGHLSDTFNAPACTATAFMLLAIPGIGIFRAFGHVSMTATVVLMMITGALVNGPYALITTAVSANLGTHSSISGDAKALATVTAIIDGTGSIGAALGPLITGKVKWEDAFHMLMLSALMAGVALSKAVLRECRGQVDGKDDFQHRTPTSTPRGSTPHTPFSTDSPRASHIEPGYYRQF